MDYTYQWKITSEFDGNHILHVTRSDGQMAKVWWGIVEPSKEKLESLNYHPKNYWTKRG